MVTRERGQAYTLEGLVSALVVLTALLFALQGVVLTPTTAGTVDQSIKSQLHTETSNALAVAGDRGGLRDLVLYYNTSTGTFHEASEFPAAVGYANNPPCRPAHSPTGGCDSVGRLFNATLASQGFQYNMYVDYRTEDGGTAHVPVVYRGSPSSNAITATYTLVLYDDDRLTVPGQNETLGELPREAFYAPDIADDSPVYNVVEVRVVVW